MAIKDNNSSENLSRVLYTGVQKCKVIAINPTLAELTLLGINTERMKDPVYTMSTEKGEYSKITIWVNAKGTQIFEKDGTPETYNVNTHFDILISDREEIASTLSQRYINKFGNFTWAKSLESLTENPKMDWFSREGLHIAHEGEKTLIDFITKWLNVISGEDCCIDNWKALLSGNVAEIKPFVKMRADNTVKLNFIVKPVEKEGKTIYYQNVVPYAFARETDTELTKFKEEISKVDVTLYQNSLIFKKFIKPVDVAEQDPFTASEKNDELPFG